MKRALIFFAAGLALVTISCSKQPTNAKALQAVQRKIKTAIPVGMPQIEAQAVLTRHGVTFSYLAGHELNSDSVQPKSKRGKTSVGTLLGVKRDVTKNWLVSCSVMVRVYLDSRQRVAETVTEPVCTGP